ncbi:MAG: family 20 glycosylhydrolase [Bacteroidales bacterium]|nr:family 20 glycosylhydrolase [Bacteroidales bacterium]
MPKYFLFILLIFIQLQIVAQNLGIIPAPQEITMQHGTFIWDSPVFYFEPAIKNTDLLLDELKELPECEPIVSAVPDGRKDRPTIYFQYVKEINAPQFPAQSYRIQISERRILVQAQTDQAFFYAVQSLKQMYRFHYRLYFTKDEMVSLPCCSILDYPALEYRGWMDDISRGPIPTLDFMKEQIRILAEYKLNCFTLYTEHTFKSSKHPYAPQDGLTAAEIRELDAYAKKYYVELIGNQQCFAHFEKILAQPDYAHLADSKCNLNPALEETYRFLDDIIQEESQAYSSIFFNINCDETESLGTGNAAGYVNKIGSNEAYIRHIVKVDNMVKRYGKKTLMWADIVLKDKEIQNRLPKDIGMLVWSYVPADSFTAMINPIRDAGYDFWVVPGISMWSTVFPMMPAYEKNIANMARDGYQSGARGLINTAWNDAGEGLLQNAWHGFAWGAEMSWNPIVQTEPSAAEEERFQRIATFDTNFNFQFFHFYNNENIIADFLRVVPRYQDSDMPEICNFSSLWENDPCHFFPDRLTPDKKQQLKLLRFDLFRTIELEKLILSETAQYEHPEIIYGALYAANRMLYDLMIKNCQFGVYNMRQHPETLPPDARQRLEEDIQDLSLYLKGLQNNFLYFWGLQYRENWRDVDSLKYNILIDKLLDIPQHTFITLHSGEHPALVLETLLHDCPIHYTLNGSTPTASSPVYEAPIPLGQTCVVKTLTVSPEGKEVRNAKVIAVHPGMWAKAEVSAGTYSTYRPEYSGGGSNALFDGEIGSDSYRDGKWQGYQGQDVTVEYHWNQMQKIGKVTVRYLQNFYDWILAPQDIEIYASTDGIEYKLVKKQHFAIEQIQGNHIGTCVIEKLKANTQHLKITIKNPGPLPKEHGAAGAESYIFLDEIIISE